MMVTMPTSSAQTGSGPSPSRSGRSSLSRASASGNCSNDWRAAARSANAGWQARRCSAFARKAGHLHWASQAAMKPNGLPWAALRPGRAVRVIWHLPCSSRLPQ
eukprot:9496871-Pyramimonas_sp.AAC.1